MWTEQDIDNMLRGYRSDYGRYRHLMVEVELLRRSCDKLRRDMVDDMVAPKAQVITDMPRGGNRISSTVESVAVKLADGYMTPEYEEEMKKLEQAEQKLAEAERTVSYVNAWLDGLTERERWIIQHQYINGEVWSDVMDDYDRAFGKGLSKDSLKRLRAKAMARIYLAAGCE